MNLQNYYNNGYVMIAESETSITLEKAKSVSFIEGMLIIVGFPMLLLFGAGLLMWLLAILSYMMKGNERVTVSKVDKKG